MRYHYDKLIKSIENQENIFNLDKFQKLYESVKFKRLLNELKNVFNAIDIQYQYKCKFDMEDLM